MLQGKSRLLSSSAGKRNQWPNLIALCLALSLSLLVHRNAEIILCQTASLELRQRSMCGGRVGGAVVGPSVGGGVGGIFKVSAHMQPDSVMHVMTTHSINHEPPEADGLKVCICVGEEEPEVNFLNCNFFSQPHCSFITDGFFSNSNFFCFSAHFIARLLGLPIAPILRVLNFT